jgi:hypothetical protein
MAGQRHKVDFKRRPFFHVPIAENRFLSMGAAARAAPMIDG